MQLVGSSSSASSLDVYLEEARGSSQTLFPFNARIRKIHSCFLEPSSDSILNTLTMRNSVIVTMLAIAQTANADSCCSVQYLSRLTIW